MTVSALFFFHVFFLLTALLCAFILGKSTLQAFTGILVVIGNVFFTQVFSDPAYGGAMYIVCSTVGLLFLRRFYGDQIARITAVKTVILMLAFYMLNLLQSSYVISSGGPLYQNFFKIMTHVPWAALISLLAHFITQLIALLCYNVLESRWGEKIDIISYALASCAAQVFDAFFFYGSLLWGGDWGALLAVIRTRLVMKFGIIAVSVIIFCIARQIDRNGKYIGRDQIGLEGF